MRSLKPGDLHAASKGPLSLAAHGFFWTGMERKATPGGRSASPESTNL